MNLFPLQSELIEAVIGFANADLAHPEDVRKYFKGTWEPDSIPKLRTCRVNQTDVRQWLMTAAQFEDRDCFDAMRGLEWNFKGEYLRIDPGIRLQGFLSTKKVPVPGGFEERIAWIWRVSNASLRAICGLAVGTIIQEGFHRRVGSCARDECQNIFLDLESRGVPRKYCKTVECEKVINRQRVKESRANPKSGVRKKKTRTARQ